MRRPISNLVAGHYRYSTAASIKLNFNDHLQGILLPLSFALPDIAVRDQRGEDVGRSYFRSAASFARPFWIAAWASISHPLILSCGTCKFGTPKAMTTRLQLATKAERARGFAEKRDLSPRGDRNKAIAPSQSKAHPLQHLKKLRRLARSCFCTFQHGDAEDLEHRVSNSDHDHDGHLACSLACPCGSQPSAPS
jgi:hypothetical protein